MRRTKAALRPDTVAGDLEAHRGRFGFLMRESARLMRRHFIQRSREVGLPLNQSEASALLQVAREPGQHQIALARTLDIEPIVLVRLLDSLQEAGLVERRALATDRRVRTIWLTRAARPVLAQIDAIRQQVHEDALAGLSQSDRETLLNALVTVRRNLTHATAPDPPEGGESAGG